MRLNFGPNVIDYTLPDHNVLGIIEPARPQVRPFDILVKESLLNPIGKERLRTILHRNRPGEVVIIVSDRTRSIVHYAEILGLLVGELVDSGVDEQNIECLVALGTHRPHTIEENRDIYGDMERSIRFTFHDCHKELVSIGTTSTDLNVCVNKRAYQADFVIATGKIDFHYMAGFSGGRKAVLPGIAGYDTIQGNHCKLKREGVVQGALAGNVIAREMQEAAEMFGLDYLVNVVETADNETCNVVSGDPVHAFDQGISRFREQRCMRVQRIADCAVVSAGGCRGDRTFYVGHKVLNNVIPIVKPGGTIILVAQCALGVGNDAFLQLLSQRTVDDLLCAPEHTITIGGQRAYQTARILQDYKIIVVSDLDDEVLSNMKFSVVSNIAAAFEQVKEHNGDDFTCYVVPDGHTVMGINNGTC